MPNRLPDPAGLPPLLRFNNGHAVTTPADWRARRLELLDLFSAHIYGRAPVERPAQLAFAIEDTDPAAMDGAATLKRVTIRFAGPGGAGALNLALFIPNQRPRPAPGFLLICNRSQANIDPSRRERSPFWPAERIVARGYAAAAFQVDDLDPDRDDGFKNGVHGIFDPPGRPRAADAWGAIAAWAWGARRVMDYAETDPDLDHRRLALIGHSRGGKAALWAGANDERFPLVISNESGCAGAALARGKRGERIADINQRFPHWFCQQYKRYNGRDDELPVDQHQLLALMAPRRVYVASAVEDLWADPSNEFRACVLAGPAFKLLSVPDLGCATPPPLSHPLADGHIAYHIRPGAHDLTSYDWECYLDYADRHLAAP